MYSIKKIVQMLLIISEMLVSSFFIVFISNYLKPITDRFDILERFMLGFALYEILVYIFLKFETDAKKDSLITLNSLYEMTLLYFETKDLMLKEAIIKIINKELEKNIMNDKDVKNELILLRAEVNSENFNTKNIKLKKILNSHNYELLQLEWNHTFILRYFK